MRNTNNSHLKGSLLLLLISSLVLDSAAAPLNKSCPAYFQKLDDGSCQLVTLYDRYDSPNQHGGVQANLPKLESRFTPEQIDLGRYLFFDPILSANRDMSCASCHQPDNGLSDGRSKSLSGLNQDGRRDELTRSTPSLWNIGFLTKLMWDGRSENLQEQALLPLFADNEMGNTPEGIESTLAKLHEYVDMFDQAFQQPPSASNVAIALAAFQTSLVSFNSRYDRYAHGDESALNEQELKGYNAFRGFVGRCSQCHVPPLFTDNQLAVVGSPVDDLAQEDLGAGELSADPFLRGAFRVPTLRNITKTAPYFHSGQFQDLEQVLEFYNNTRGHMAKDKSELKLHWHIHMTKGPELSQQDMQDIIAFLATLEDQTSLPPVPQSLPSGLSLSTSLTN